MNKGSRESLEDGEIISDSEYQPASTPVDDNEPAVAVDVDVSDCFAAIFENAGLNELLHESNNNYQPLLKQRKQKDKNKTKKTSSKKHHDRLPLLEDDSNLKSCKNICSESPCESYYLDLSSENEDYDFSHDIDLQNEDITSTLTNPLEKFVNNPQNSHTDSLSSTENQVQYENVPKNNDVPINDNLSDNNNNAKESYKTPDIPIKLFMESILDPAWDVECPLNFKQFAIKNGILVTNDIDDPIAEEALKLDKFPGLVPAWQREKLKELGIYRLDQYNHLSISCLNELGLNNMQKRDKVESSNQDYSSLDNIPTNNISISLNDDTTLKRNVNTKAETPNDESDYENFFKNASFDDEPASQTWLTDDSKLTKHDSNTSEDEKDFQNLVEIEQEVNKMYLDKSVVNQAIISSNCTSETLKKKPEISYAPIFESNLITFTEKLEKDIQASNLTTTNEFYKALPFTPSLLDYTPATEINASLNLHPPIKYKLIPIHIPESKNKKVKCFNSIPHSVEDPRLKRIKQLKQEGIQESKLLTHKSKSYSFPASVDPRKKLDIIDKPNINRKAIVQNITAVLNGYLYHSKWYQDQSTNGKIQINQLFSRLSYELSIFHQNSSLYKTFAIQRIEGAEKIEKILSKLGIFIDFSGNIVENYFYKDEINFSPSPSEHNRIYSINNFDRCSDTFISPTNLIPKPGLLGIAPGLQYPQEQCSSSHVNFLNGFNYAVDRNIQNFHNSQHLPPVQQQLPALYCGPDDNFNHHNQIRNYINDRKNKYFNNKCKNINKRRRL